MKPSKTKMDAVIRNQYIVYRKVAKLILRVRGMSFTTSLIRET